MKIDKGMIYKKIVFIAIIVTFLSIVETAISKMISTSKSSTTRTQKQLIVPVVTGNRAPKITQPISQPYSVEASSYAKATEDTSKGRPLQPVIAKLSLEQIHALSQGQDNGAITRSLRITPLVQIQSDKFTQSQAHMSLPEIKKLIEEKYNLKPYQKMIDTILNREKEYKDNYYVFYHGMKNVWYVPQDLYTRLYFHFKKLPANLLQSFLFLRFDGIPASPVSVQDFLVKKLKENGLINDHDLKDRLLSVNLALFGSVGDDPECTWQYFMQGRKSMEPDRQIYEKILDSFGLPYTYIDELMKLSKFFTTSESSSAKATEDRETIVQIFVPKNKVDQIGYLAWIRGNPAHQKTMDMVLQSLQDKKFEKSPLAMDYYTALFKREQEKNPIFSNLLERVYAGDFTLSYFLKFYCNYPELIKDINRYQARLIFTPDVLLNPLSGVKIFRYSAVRPEQMQKYHQKFDDIFKKIIAPKSQVTSSRSSSAKNKSKQVVK